MSDTSRPSPELLLQNLGWLRALARGLVRDLEQADELVQETLLVALNSPPPQPHALRAWLRRVARNLSYRSHRSRVRRDAREQRAALGAHHEIVDTLEQVELQHRLVEAVLGLSDPYRATILLHYFEELSADEVAARLNTSIGTIRVRIHRALEQLRQRLDDGDDDRRARWRRGLIALAEPPLRLGTPTSTTAAATSGGVAWIGSWLMGSKILAVAAVAVTIGGLWWLKFHDHADSGDRSSHSKSIASLPSSVQPGGDNSVANSSPPNGTTAPVIASSTLIGTVIDSEGRPVADVRVRLRGADRSFECESDVGGRVAWSTLPPLPLTIEITDDHYLPIFAPIAVNTVAATHTHYSLPVRLGASVAGRVLDAKTGQPVDRGLVHAIPDGHDGPTRRAIPTDVQGEFRITGLSAGHYRFHATRHAQGWPFPRNDVLVQTNWSQSVTGLELADEAGITIRGHVVDTERREVAGAVVSVSNGGYARDADRIVSDANGRFELQIQSTPQPALSLQARRTDASGVECASAWTDPFNSAGVLLDNVELVAEATGSIEGRVIDRQGNPRAHYAGMRLLPVDVTEQLTSGLRSDAAGRFVLTGIRPGEYYFGNDRLRVVAGERISDLEYLADDPARDASLAGQVVDTAGRPLAGVELVVSKNDHEMRGASSADGQFEIVGLATGRHTIHAMHASHATLTQEIEVDGSRIELTLTPAAQLAGFVVDAETDRPITRFRIGAWPGAHTRASEFRVFRNTLTDMYDPHGAFLLRYVTGDVTTLVAEAPGYMMFHEVVSALKPGTLNDGHRIALTPIGPARGRVIDASGQAVAGAVVCLFRMPVVRGVPTTGTIAVAGANGEFVVEQLLAATGELWAYHDQHGPGHARYTLENLRDGSFVIALPRAARIRGTVTLGGRPAADVEVRLSTQSRTVDQTRTDERGAYELAVGVGAYLLVATIEPGATDARTMRREIEVAEGAEPRIDFEFAAGAERVLGRVRRGGEAPARPAFVSLVKTDGGEDALAETSTSAETDGTFELRDCPVGRFTLIVRAEFAGSEVATKAQEIVIEPGLPLRVDVDFGLGKSVVVVIEDLPAQHMALLLLFEGELSVEKFTRQIVMQHAAKIRGQQTAQASGTIAIDSVAPGRYTMLCVWGEAAELNRGAEDLPFRVVTVHVSATRETTITLSLGEAVPAEHR
ncbi:MAG: sigma-70 family RNA polymerase sigma factor [Planctomycetota bacterium]